MPQRSLEEAELLLQSAESQLSARNDTQAESLILQAIALSPRNAKAHAALAHILHKRGDLLQALHHHRLAQQYDARNPTHVFNCAMMQEYTDDVPGGLNTLQQFMGTLSEDEFQTVHHFALFVLMVKLLYLTNQRQRILSLLADIDDFDDEIIQAMKSLGAHWSFVVFIRALCQTPAVPIQQPYELLHVVGDSHCLSSAFRPCTLADVRHVFIPKLVTGLKAWHLRNGTQHQTISNLNAVLAGLQSRKVTLVVICCGELDCREGIPTALRKQKYTSLEEAVHSTVQVYASGLLRLAELYQVKFYVHPVPPAINAQNADDLQCRALFNTHLQQAIASQMSDSVRWLDLFKALCSPDGTMLPVLNLDGTHMGPRYSVLLEYALQQAMAP